jgi:iron(III) transport system permease protein
MLQGRSWSWLVLAAVCLAAGIGLLRQDPRQLLLLTNTLWLAAGACAISLPLGTAFAFLLRRTDVFGRRLALALAAGMLMVPLYLQAAAWDAGFGQLGWCSLVRGPAVPPLLSGGTAAVWVHGMAAVPWVVMLVSAALAGVEPELEEEALLMGSAWQVFRRVTLPRMTAGVAVAAGWVLLSTSVEMTVTDLFRVRTYAEEIYTGFALGDSLADAWRAAAPGILAQAALILVAIAVALRAAPSLSTPLRPVRILRLQRARVPAAAATLLFCLFIAGLPLVNLVAKAGLVVQQAGGERLRQWSAGHSCRIVASSLVSFQREFGWSLLIGGMAATCALIAGAGLAWWARRGGWRALPALTLGACGLAIPGPLIGLGIIWIMDRSEPSILIWLYDRTILAPVLAIAIRTLPLATLCCWYVLRSVADDALDCAACEGADPWARFWLVAWPQRRFGLAAAWLAVFALATGDLACSILVVPPGVTTVPIRVFGLIHAGVDDQVAGLCLIMFAAVAAAVAAVLGLLYRHQRTAADSAVRSPDDFRAASAADSARGQN